MEFKHAWSLLRSYTQLFQFWVPDYVPSRTAQAGWSCVFRVHSTGKLSFACLMAIRVYFRTRAFPWARLSLQFPVDLIVAYRIPAPETESVLSERTPESVGPAAVLLSSLWIIERLAPFADFFSSCIF